MSGALEFGEYIKNLRREAGLTIRQLEEKSGVSNAYLSQIENGKRGMPSPEILMKIHVPLEIGYDELMERAGYISKSTRSELIPETVSTIESYNSLMELIQNAADIFIRSITNDKGLLKHEFKEILMDSSDDADLNEMMDNPNFAYELFEHLTLEEKIKFLNILIKDFVDHDMDPTEVFQNTRNINDNIISTYAVPVVGSIAAGYPIIANEQIEEWIEIPNMWNLKAGEAMVLKVKGDSMIGSRIYEGDKVVVKLQQDVENGEIAVVNVNGDEATLKRVKKTDNGEVILYPDNPKYDPIFISNDNARIIGKVIQVIFEPK